MKKLNFIFVFFFVFLTLPDWLLVFNLNNNFDIGWPSFFKALLTTLVQASLSSVLAITGSLFLAIGLISLKNQKASYRKWLHFLCLIPSATPTLFVVLVFLYYIQSFPYGLWGVVLVQGFINMGYAGVYFADLFEKELSALGEVCLVEGASSTQFLWQGLKILKNQITTQGFFVFAICITSFSVPLLIGAGKVTTLEILIYEKIKVSGNYDIALNISILQAVLIFTVAALLKPKLSTLDKSNSHLQIINNKLTTLAPLFYSIGFLGLFLFSLGRSLFLVHWSDLDYIFNAIPFSLIFSWCVGLLTFALLFLFAYGYPNLRLNKYINGLAQPSTALLGLAILYVQLPQMMLLLYTLGFSSFIFLSIYRMGWMQDLSALGQKVQVAQVLGADANLIFKNIQIPLLAKRAGFLGAIASFWALGDFALARIVLNKDLSLAMNLQTLLSSYRLETAFVTCGIILLICALNFLLFTGLGYVVSKKLN